MPSRSALSLLLALALARPAVAADPHEPRIVQTVRTEKDGTVEVEQTPHDADTAAMSLIVGANGRVKQIRQRRERRVLIEMKANALLDRTAPGSSAAAAGQREQFADDLLQIDAQLQSTSQITREYETLFSGVAATVSDAAVAEIRRLPYVAAVHEDFEIRANRTDRVAMIGLPAVEASYDVTGAGVTVAIIDTGIDYTHPDLGGCFGVECKVAGGYDFVNDDANPTDDNGHGTHVAGIVAADGAGEGAMKGVAPGATLLAYKVLDQWGSGDASDVIAALEQAVLDGAKIANLSLGGDGNPDDPLSQAADNATAAGMLIVAAAGNSGDDFNTIESPGTARTALTVGSASAHGYVSYFSSRGYITADGELVMKPDVVAPGESIRSTVPTTGEHGHASRYAELSGTSMAAPHVAGAAALLLEWDAVQTPADLRNRLAGSARSLNAHTFAEGAGTIDLAAAFAATTVASTTHVPMGLVTETTGTLSFQKTFSVRNTATTSQTLSLAEPSPSPLPAGATLQITPASIALEPGASATITLRLDVDAAVAKEADADPLSWTTRVRIAAGEQTTSLPVYFFKGAVLNLTLDESPWIVTLQSLQPRQYRTIVSPATSSTLIMRSGTWDVAAHYRLPYAVVVREQQTIAGRVSLSIQRADAVRTIRFNAVDDAQQPLRAGTFSSGIGYGLRDPSVPGQLVTGSFTASGYQEFRMSPLSSRYAVAVTGGGPDPEGSRVFTYSWSGAGLASDVTLPMAGVPMRQLTRAVMKPSGDDAAYLMMGNGVAGKFRDSAIALTAASGIRDKLSRTMYFQSIPGPLDLGLLSLRSAEMETWNPETYETPERIEGGYMKHEGGDDIALDTQTFFGLFKQWQQPVAVLGASVTRWDLDTAPYFLPLQFSNSFGVVRASHRGSWPKWLSQTFGGMDRSAGQQPAFSLYRNGLLVHTAPVRELQWSTTSEEGPHELRASLTYPIGDRVGSASVATSFDTSKTDSNPPTLADFSIEQNGRRTGTPVQPSTSSTTFVKFKATDDNSVTAATLEWRQNGTTSSWTNMPLTQSGGYTTPLKIDGAVDLRLTLSDAAGNTFRQEWTPAFVSAAFAPPTRPTSVTATRSGATAVTLSWPAGTSDVGIAGYRIERVPGGIITTTSGPATTFTDTNGLVAENAYLYRVSTIDVNGASSAPSDYDLATLTTFQDDPVTPLATRVRGVHIDDLRRAIDVVRQAAGLPKWWPLFVPTRGPIKAADFLSLRDPLNEARAALNLKPVQFSVPPAARTTVLRSCIQELRDGVQ